ncbi:spore cortex biosynthesis protein YabQ [Candidatus Soleaferrea massiliensis]|uniref:spore cortex biosynthesis protein YabQ n=1 Tax=Candidatus Soleaferrea massiliensis TaxID=1470354 RepID=UPI0006939662|nr:spore cortex biosynthesis protein YabQ [Candidatus Soleaferrea massiliensis]
MNTLELQVSAQTLLFLQSCLLGAVLGVIYDVFRILRISFKNGSILIFLEDALFFIICAVLTFCFMLMSNDGQIRFFILLGEVIGFILYYFTIGALVMKISKLIINFIRRLFLLLYKIFIRPFVIFFRFLFRKISPVFKKISGNCKKIEKKAKFSLKERRIVLYNLINRKKKRGDAPDDASHADSEV